MNMAPDALANATVMVLSLDPPPTEAQIDEALARIAIAFGAGDDVKAEARRILHSRFRILMDLGTTLTPQDGHVAWLDARRAELDPFFWARYRQFLLRDGWSPLVLATLDRATDELVNLLGNPASPGPWKRRGLVMGDVQSGKTASYAALMCKAADAGYRMIILLTGTLENVRRQTQGRLDAAFVGFDSSNYLVRGTQRQKRHIGVGLIDGRRDGVVFTSSDHDFRKNAASALNISLSAVNEPVLVVSKKNKGVLERLTDWLRVHNADRDGFIDVPMLLIDDEADSASVNTNQQGNPTTINASIRSLLKLFSRSSYVGFTATPFANIFIEPATTDEMIGDDLFPRDFIHVLEPPNNYVGMKDLFPPIDAEDDDETGVGPIITISDAEHWLPPGHQANAEPGDIPKSLEDAVRIFLMTCALRDLREQQGFPGGGGGIHRSMLVNVTHFTDVQNKVANELHNELEAIRQAVRLHGAIPPDRARLQSPEIARLEDLFNSDLPNSGQKWETVLPQLHSSIAPVKVQPVNRSTGTKGLDYGAVKDAPGLRVIAVGGNSLSRGLTLEGLSTSYFLRNSRAYDTLLQMGRWFGYRPGYGDLCRIWLSREAQGWYRHIAEATVELKRDFVRMKRGNASPSEFGLRVRKHPESLLITARNKMASGMDVVSATHEISLAGRLVESARLYKDRRRNEENYLKIRKLFDELKDSNIAPVNSPFGGALVWRQVPAEIVADFLERFAVHPLNFAFQGDSIAEFLRDAARRGDAAFGKWTIALPTRGEGKEESLAGSQVKARERLVVPNDTNGSLLVSGRSARVGGKADVRHGLAREQMPQGDPDESEIREALPAPLMVIYLLQGKVSERESESQLPYLDGLILPAVGLHFPGRTDAAQEGRRLTYRLNRIAQQQLFDVERGDDLEETEDGN